MLNHPAVAPIGTVCTVAATAARDRRCPLVDPLLLLLRQELSRKLSDVAGTMSATIEVLTATRTVAGDVRGTESLRAAIEELGATRNRLLGQAQALEACAPAA